MKNNDEIASKIAWFKIATVYSSYKKAMLLKSHFLLDDTSQCAVEKKSERYLSKMFYEDVL